MNSALPFVRHKLFAILVLGGAENPSRVRAQYLVRDPDPGDADRVVVIAEGDQGYAAHDSQVGTKTDTPLIEVPQSVQVVDSQLIEDRRITTLQGALNNVSGVSDTGSRRGFDSYSIRGFNAFGTAYLDGLKVERGNAWFEQEVSMLERVEVLKGPGSVLFGQGSLGGIVNEVSRRPPGTRVFNVDVTFGSFDYYEVRADVGGPLNQSGSVRARFDGLYRNRGDFVDYGGRERIYLTPSLSWDIGPQTTVTFIANYTRDEVFPYEGIPAAGSVLYNPNGEIPRNRFDGEPSLDRFSIARGYLESLFEHHFSDHWTLHQNARVTLSSIDNGGVFINDLSEDERTITRTYSPHFYHKDRSVTVDTNLEGHFDTWGVKHTFLAGLDLLAQRVTREYQSGSIGSLDLFDPHYGATGFDVEDFGVDKRRDFLLGLYLQDQIKFFDRVSLVLGGRYDLNATQYGNDLAGTADHQIDNSLVPRVGLVYEFVPGASVYASYAESFQPQTGFAYDGSTFDPETGQQYELGAKTALFGGRLVSTVAIYQLTRQNVLTTDQDHPHFSIQTGEQRSRGVELDLAYQIKKGWNVTAAYAYTDSKVTQDNDIPVGSCVDNIPHHTANLWMSYELQTGRLRGLGAGAGIHYIGERAADLPNTFTLPNYATVDAALYFRRDRLRAQVNLNNLLDKDYYASSYGRNYVFPGEPITVQGTLGWSF